MLLIGCTNGLPAGRGMKLMADVLRLTTGPAGMNGRLTNFGLMRALAEGVRMRR